MNKFYMAVGCLSTFLSTVFLHFFSYFLILQCLRFIESTLKQSFFSNINKKISWFCIFSPNSDVFWWAVIILFFVFLFWGVRSAAGGKYLCKWWSRTELQCHPMMVLNLVRACCIYLMLMKLFFACHLFLLHVLIWCC